jgi:major membrane immunogen (membrane-anchored lipoprotein)
LLGQIVREEEDFKNKAGNAIIKEEGRNKKKKMKQMKQVREK